MITKLAVWWLCEQLKKDKSYWIAWQSSIAVTISDTYDEYMPLTTGKSSPTLHEWCNICADRFLRLLTR